jgi:hypothetical protein
VADDVERILDDCVRGGAFFVPPPGRLRIERSPGARRVFLDCADVPNERPLIEVMLDAGRVRVRRQVAMRGGSWVEEEVGTAPPHRRELVERCIEKALVGTSRLPITSPETPLPAYTLGMIAYLSGVRAGDDALPLTSPLALAPHAAHMKLDVEWRARTLDIILRGASPDQVPILARTLSGRDPAPALRAMFNLLVLSPYTCLVDNLVSLLHHLDRDVARDAIGYMLRHLARHLNAFDLVKFHNRGANYPDALLLDALLRAFIPMIDDHPPSRRALLHGWLARKRCENLLVPAAPTSPGEAARLMPPDIAAAADPEHRTRRLFHAEPAEAMLKPPARDALRTAAAEDDLTELGRATFLDRPLGTTKRPGEADRTPLVSYEAFSRRLAQRRVKELAELGVLSAAREIPAAVGYPVAKMLGHTREGVVALEDAKRVALDFVFTRTTRSSLDALLRNYDWSNVDEASLNRIVLLIRTGRGIMTAFDADHRPIFTLKFAGARHRECGGEEFVDGLEAVVDDHPPVPIPPRCE